MGQSKPLCPIAIVAQDDADERCLVSALLEETEMHVVECESAEAAVVVLERYREAVAFLFTDVNLAGAMSGIELANFARRRFPALAVIVTSGKPCRGLPADAKFMRKPWRALDVLIEAERAKH